MFEVNDRVVDSGFRAGANGEHLFSTTQPMREAAKAGTVMTVSAVSPTRIRVTIPGSTPQIHYSYALSELRYATPAEIAQADAAKTPKITPPTARYRQAQRRTHRHSHQGRTG